MINVLATADGYQKLAVSMHMDLRPEISDKKLAEASAARSFLAAEWSVTAETADGTPIQRYDNNNSYIPTFDWHFYYIEFRLTINKFRRLFPVSLDLLARKMFL